MSLKQIFSPHILRPWSNLEAGKRDFVGLLRKIHCHSVDAPKIKEIRATAKQNTKDNIQRLTEKYNKIENFTEKHQSRYNKRISAIYGQEKKNISHQEYKNAYQLAHSDNASYSASYSASGGFFSCAQQIANRSGVNILGLVGEDLHNDQGNAKQSVFFKPQNMFLASISRIGNFILSKKCLF